MSAPNTYAVSQLLGSLGVKGGSLPRIALSTYQPVLVMGDFSKTLASEPLEARGFSAEFTAAVGGKIIKAEIKSMSPGGIVLERLCLSMTEWAVALKYAHLSINWNPYSSALSMADVVPVGGRDPVSFVKYGADDATAIARQATICFPVGERVIDLSDQRIYVPGGKHLLIQSGHLGMSMGYEFIWRELPDPIGAP